MHVCNSNMACRNLETPWCDAKTLIGNNPPKDRGHSWVPGIYMSYLIYGLIPPNVLLRKQRSNKVVGTYPGNVLFFCSFFGRKPRFFFFCPFPCARKGTNTATVGPYVTISDILAQAMYVPSNNGLHKSQCLANYYWSKKQVIWTIIDRN